MKFLSNMFDSVSRRNKRLLNSVGKDKRPALSSVLEGKTDFRDHEEFQDMRAVLRVLREYGNGQSEQVGKVLDVHVSQLPKESVYESPEFFNGLWPYYTVKVTDEPEQKPVYESTLTLDLNDGTKRELKL